MFEVDFLNRIIEYTVLTTKMEVIHRKQSSAGVTGLLTLERILKEKCSRIE